MTLLPSEPAAPHHLLFRPAVALLLLFAAGLQTALASRLALLGGQPDFVLTVALTGALLTEPVTAALCGFAAGLLTAALTGETVGTFLVSRTLAGWAGGVFARRVFRGNLPVIVFSVFVLTLSAHLLYLLAAPGVALRVGGLAPLVQATQNALLALPVGWLLRRLSGVAED